MKRKMMNVWIVMLALAILSTGLLASCGVTSETPNIPSDETSNDPVDTPVGEEPTENMPSKLSERETAIVTGSLIHENTLGQAPYGLTEVKNKYMTVLGGLDMQGSVITFQTQSDYAMSHHVYADGVSVFADSPQDAEKIMSTWKRQDDTYKLSFMTVINRCVFSEYEQWCIENGRDDTPPTDDIQTYADGSYKGKTDGETMYMVPTARWIDFVWDTIETAMNIADFEYIMPEEPDIHRKAGYSPAFKAEWEAYYGEPWQAGTTSPEAMLKTQELMVHLIERAYTVLGERIKAKNPNTKLCIATHSTPSYNTMNCQITSGVNTYLSSGIFDAVNAQTWSDTIGTNLTVNGESIKDFFTAGYLGYASYVDAAGDIPLYAATDALGDGAAKNFTTEDFYYPRYYAQLVTQLMQPEINRFSVVCWPARSFDAASQDYRLVQQAAAAAVREASGEETVVSAGTPGITYLLSDSLSWQWDEKGWSLSTHDGFLGVTYPLVSDGIPLKIKAMEMVDTADDLDEVTMLLVSFDCQKPQSEDVVDAIADWVRAGGQLLYVGGRDRYDEISSKWWAEYGSPLQALLDKLELDVKVRAPESVGDGTLHWLGDRKQNVIAETGLAAHYLDYTVTFDGDVNAILTTSDGAVLGFDAKVGQGRVVMVGAPSALYAQSDCGSKAMRTLAEYACSTAAYEYDSTKLMWAKRGNIVAAHSYETKNMLTGRYVDLLHPMMTVHRHYILEPGQSALLYDVNDLDLSVPRLAFSGGEVVDLQETADTTSFTVRSAQGAAVGMRLFSAEGLYPQSISVVKGRMPCDFDYSWDTENSTLFIRFKGATKGGLAVSVSWGETPVEDVYAITLTEKQNQEILAMGYELLNPDVSVWEGMTKYTFAINATTGDVDGAFIHKNTGELSSYGRYCDHQNELVYRFDLERYPDLVAVMKICSNYLVEVSTDGENWKTIQDYGEVSGGRMTGTSNAATIAVDSSKYAAGKREMYVRLGSSGGGNWGGCIVQLDLYYTAVDVPETPVENYAADKFDVTSYQNDDYRVKWVHIAGREALDPDAEFIVINTSVVSDAKIGRCCDRQREIIYRFDLEQYSDAVVVLDICQNYLIQVSRDGMSWITVRNSELALGKKVSYKGGASKVGIVASDWLDGAGTMYVRVADADTADGYGAVLSKITIYHTGDADTTESFPASTPEPEPEMPKPSTDHYLPVAVVTGQVTSEAYLGAFDATYTGYQRDTYRLSGEAPDDVTGFEVKNTSKTDSSVGQFCDHGAEIIYRFDLSAYRQAKIVLALGQNYCLQVSTDGKSFTTVQDYVDINGVRTTDRWFRHAFCIDSAVHAKDSDVLYVRIGGSGNAGGFGGLLEHFAIYYQ